MFKQITRAPHRHVYYVDASTGDRLCTCGKQHGVKPASKYHSRAQVYNDHCYHSGLESSYAAELDWRIKAKEITKWERQVKLDLRVNGMHVNNYYIDFVVHYPDGSREFVEVKGMELEPWKTNWKILQATFGDFKQHPDDRLLVVKESRSKYYGQSRR